ncbi:signal peptidase I [Wukongibacter baidiensis]
MTFKHILMVVIVLFTVVSFFFKPIKLKGSSMYPAFDNGDWVLVNKMAYSFNSPKREDVIVFKLNKHNSKYIIKRVIGLENETVEIVSSKIYINDNKIDEPYATEVSNDNFYRRFIPKNHFFVLGDNRKISIDSRYEEIGFINKENIIGKIIFKW